LKCFLTFIAALGAFRVAWLSHELSYDFDVPIYHDAGRCPILCAGETGADSERSVIMQETRCSAKPNKQEDEQIAKPRKEAVTVL
jgi:hypothetical protein